MRLGSTQTIVFKEVRIQGSKSGKCRCGNRRTRRETFWQTLNPYNKKKDGTEKSYEDILVELKKEREKWLKVSIHCEACKPRSKVSID